MALGNRGGVGDTLDAYLFFVHLDGSSKILVYFFWLLWPRARQGYPAATEAAAE